MVADSGRQYLVSRCNTHKETTMNSIHIQDVDDKNNNQHLDLTPIQEFYNNANIFITGSTGFLGRILVEKLLRSCPAISTIYLLIRNKRGQTVSTRIDELFDDVIFDRMKKECPKFQHKVVGIRGDCSLPDLGLNFDDKELLIQKVNIIFHVAATIRFNEELKLAVAINIRASRDLQQLAQQMPNLKSILHVSTAFSNCIESVVEERVYPAPIDYKKLIGMTENLSEKILNRVTPKLVDKYPNTYVYTKQIAEDVVKHEGQGLPVGIFRPSIVVSTYKEPIKGWINNMYGISGVVAGCMLGQMRALYSEPTSNANLVPIDMCVNSMIAAAWEVGTTFEKQRKENQEANMLIYNYESSTDKAINWGDYVVTSEKYLLITPTIKCVWYYGFGLIRHYPMYLLSFFFSHVIPAMVVDGVLLFTGKSPRMLKLTSKIYKVCAVLAYFLTTQTNFKSENVQKLIAKMSDRDRTIFFSDLKQLDWDEFCQSFIRGIRVFLIRDPIDTLPEARKKWNRLYWADQILKSVIGFLLLGMLWLLFSYLYSTYYK